MKSRFWTLGLLPLAFSGCDQPKAAPAGAAVEAPAPAPAPASGVMDVDYICDGIDKPRVVVIHAPGADGRAAIETYDKTAFAAPARESLTIGEGDPGAGQVYFPLTRHGQEVGAIHTFNPGMLDDPTAAALPPLVSLKIDDLDLECRWIPGGLFLGVAGRRTLMVSRTSSGDLAYTTFDYADAPRASLVEAGAGRSTTPSLDIVGGRETKGPAGTDFTFANKGYGYRIHVGSAAASVTVERDGKVISTQPFVAWIGGGD